MDFHHKLKDVRFLFQVNLLKVMTEEEKMIS
jgi:hypothetical protein